MNFEQKKGRIRILGLGKQDFIKYFFGGNATLCSFILALMGAFLLKEAYLFFPAHHEQLKVYRKSGLEYFTLVEESYQRYQIHHGALIRAYQAEVAYPNAAIQQKLSAYDATRSFVERKAGKELLLLRDAIAHQKEVAEGSAVGERLDALIFRLKEELTARAPEFRKSLFRPYFMGIPLPFKVIQVEELKHLGKEDRNRITEAVIALNLWESRGGAYYDELSIEFAKIQAESSEKNLALKKLADAFDKAGIAEDLEMVRNEVFQHSTRTRDREESHSRIADQIAEQVNGLRQTSEIPTRRTRLGNVIQLIANAEFFDEFAKIFYVQRFTEVLKNLEPGEKSYLSLPAQIRDEAEAVLSNATDQHGKFVAFLNSTESALDAFPKAIPEGSMEVDMRSLLFELTRLERGTDAMIRRLSDEVPRFVKEFPFDKEAAPIYALTGRFEAGLERLQVEGAVKLKELPTSEKLQSTAARKEIDSFKKAFEKDIKELEKVAVQLRDWKYDRPWTYYETAMAIFVGDQWTHHSKIMNRYGIVPLLAGSFFISFIALALAAPISITAAIYVNQMAPFREQKLLKSSIEFIGAIPPVVLGFLGIVVLGEVLVNFSHWSVLSWIPGFPIESRFNMLVAGLLLGFMSVPIIFTFAEDALNNVPTSYRDDALSLGATRLQTAFRIVLPSALSGVIAAVLLGFGRVIGETMIVLLVAGNRIVIPSKWTDPAHTMTGIIAQNMGEAPQGSLDYRALFVVGLVLLTVTLIINYIGQRFLTRRFPKIHDI